jgi:hypothetical protein
MPTYTSIFSLRRKLYAIYDWELPRPVELVQVGVFVMGVVAVWLVTRAIGVGFSPSTGWVFVVPPGALAWCATQPVADGKSVGAWLVAQVGFLFEPKALNGSPQDAIPTEMGPASVGSQD